MAGRHVDARARPQSRRRVVLWVTAVVAAYLQTAFPDEQTSWQQVVNKAKRLLAKSKKAEWGKHAEDFVKPLL